MSPREIKIIKTRHDSILEEMRKRLIAYFKIENKYIKISIAERLRELLREKKEIEHYLIMSFKQLQSEKRY